MKLPLLLSLPLLVFGFELNFTKEFSKSLLPNELTSTIKVVVEDKEEKEVISSLNMYNKFLTKYDKVKKSNLSISITPKYSYKEGQSIFEGYNGVLNYTVSSNKSSHIKEFLEKFYELKEDTSHSLLMPTMQWKIDDKSYEKELEDLRLDAIIWTNNYAKELSAKINHLCSVKQINISPNFARPSHYSSDMVMLKSSKNINMPILEKVDETITISPSIVLECK